VSPVGTAPPFLSGSGDKASATHGVGGDSRRAGLGALASGLRRRCTATSSAVVCCGPHNYMMILAVPNRVFGVLCCNDVSRQPVGCYGCGVSKRRQETTNIRCVTTQKSNDLNCIATDAWNLVFALFRVPVTAACSSVCTISSTGNCSMLQRLTF
jgi:hypothetical protein